MSTVYDGAYLKDVTELRRKYRLGRFKNSDEYFNALERIGGETRYQNDQYFKRQQRKKKKEEANV